MAITKEQILKNSHIPTSELKQDIADTQEEIDDFNKELEILNKKLVDNKVRIYMIEGHKIKEQKFLDDLKSILDYRKQHG